MLPHVRPRLASDDCADVRLRDAKQQGRGFLAKFGGANCPNIAVGEFGGANPIAAHDAFRRYMAVVAVASPHAFRASMASISLPARQSLRLSPTAVAFTGGASLARNLVSHVVGMTTPAEVSGVAARWIIASVKRERAFGAALAHHNQSDVSSQFPPAANPHFAASATIFSGPRPAFIRPAPINLSPKPGFHIGRNHVRGNVIHGAVPSRVGQGRALYQQRFRPAFPAARYAFCQGIAA